MGSGIHVLVIALLLLGVAAASTYLYTQWTGKLPTGASVNPSQGQGTSSGSSGCSSGYVAPSGWQCTSLPAQYFVFDPFAATGTANGINGAQVSVSNIDTLSSVDVPATTASTGLVTGGFTFNSGQSYWAKVATTNYVTEYLPLFIPPISTTSQVTTINIPLPEVRTNTWSWTAAITGGSTWTSTFSSYSYANTGLTEISASFTITADTNNRGYYSSYDPFNKVQNLAVLEFSSASSPATLMKGCQFSYSKNNINYCQFLLPDGLTTINSGYSKGTSAITSNFPTSIDKRYLSTQPTSQTISAGNVQVVGSLSLQFSGTTRYGGTLTVPVTFNVGSLGSGSSESVTMKVWLYADILNFVGGGGYTAQGTYGGDQLQATLTGGNSVTITLNN